ncbi:hypothetical protein ACO2KH_18700 [Leptospira terpstrae]|uniref:hypothetical protein n=1 Tax=Leptospira terpstrae TaxID=293075 RepID=UPI003D033B50
MTDKITYTYFFTTPTFWAVSKPNFNIPNIETNLYDVLSEIVYEMKGDGLTLRVARDGMIELRSDSIEMALDVHRATGEFNFFRETKLWQEYLKLANAMILLLDCVYTQKLKIGFFKFQEIAPSDVARITYEGNKFSGKSMSPHSLAQHLAMSRWASQHPRGIPLEHSPLWGFRQVVPVEVLDAVFSLLRKIISDSTKLDLISSLAKAFSEYKNTNLKLSIVLSWFIVESTMNDLYTDYLDSLPDKEKRLNKDRRKFLEGRDITASVKTNLLELLGLITYEDLQKCDRIRKLRNDIAHSVNKVQISIEDAQNAVNFCAEQIFRNIDPSIQLNFGLSQMGL